MRATLLYLSNRDRIFLPHSEWIHTNVKQKGGLTLTRKKWTPKVGRPRASLTYLYLESISEVPINALWSTKIFFSTFFTFMNPSGRNSFRLGRKHNWASRFFLLPGIFSLVLSAQYLGSNCSFPPLLKRQYIWDWCLGFAEGGRGATMVAKKFSLPLLANN